MNKAEIVSELNEAISSKLQLTSETYRFFQLDSLSVINLILELEKRFDIDVQIVDLTEERVGHFENLLDYVLEKKGLK